MTYPVSAAFPPRFGVFFLTPCTSPPHFGGRKRLHGGHLLFSVVRFGGVLRVDGALAIRQRTETGGGTELRAAGKGAHLDQRRAWYFWGEQATGRVRQEPRTVSSFLNNGEGIDVRD